MARFSSYLLLLAIPLALQARPRLVDYALVLEDAPVAEATLSRAALRSADSQARLARIESAQRALRSELARRNIAVDTAVQLVANAVFVTVPYDRAAELRALPGVKRVQRMPRLRRHMDRAIDLIRATQAWTSVGGPENAGSGVKIGIIDTGIDQTHPAFRDPGLSTPSGFPKGDAAFTTNKVIAARSYVSMGLDARDEADRPHPDDNTPRDRVGHGTAIAMIAAGVRNTGPVATIQGVAPKAWLGNYKVFGSPGVNDFTRYALIARALEDALSDGMDIVTLALGEGDSAVDGPLDRDPACSADGVTPADCDVRAQAVESAVRNGLTVVLSAGNGGDIGLKYPTLSSINSPGTAPSGITVGAVTNSHILFAGVTPQGGERMYAIFGPGARIDAPITAPLRDVGGDGLACAPLPAGSLTGTIALIQRGSCVFADKLNFAQNAGAIAAIFYQQEGREFPVQSTAQNVGIAVAGVGYRDGQTLKNLARNNINVTLDPALRPVDAPANEILASSSRGPAVSTFGIKPELVAIGTDIYTATQRFDPNGDIYDATGYTSVTGTSYAAAMVAGAAALVKQKYPNLRPAQIKSAVVNTASQDVTGDNGLAGVLDVGAGKLNVAEAVNIAVTADPATLSFGAIGTAALPINRTLTLANVSSTPASVQVAVAPRTTASATVTVNPTSATIQPGQQAQITVTLQGTRPGAGIYEGFINVTGAGSALHIPYLFLVGDGVPYEAVPVRGVGFTGYVRDRGWLVGIRVLDRYGVPVTRVPVAWRTVAGGGRVDQADVETVNNGLALALVDFGSSPGDQVFSATVQGLDRQQEFDGFARPLPAISANGVLNAASNDTNNGRLAPGSYISIYGSQLADATAVARTASLPLSLAQTAVRFEAGGRSIAAPLHFVSPGQVNVQIPWEFEGQSSADVKVSLPTITPAAYASFNLGLTTYAPGIFVRGGVAAARDVNFAVIDANNPARRGQAVQLYANGLGPVSTTPATGEPSPAQPLATTRVNPSVTIGGRPAQVLFSGLAPGNVGLYQVNVVVAADTPTGNQPVVLSIGGVESKPVDMPVQ